MRHSNASTNTLMHCATALAVVGACNLSLAQETHRARINTCETATNSRTGQHVVTYTGAVRNGDYQFEATIPDGLTGLGSGFNSPFHGFAIFIDNSGCIAFGIEHRVILPEDVPGRDRRKWVPVKVGNRKGVETLMVGTSRGRRFLNVSVLLDLPREGYMNDMSVLFVTPLQSRSRAEPIFRSFLASFKFW